MPNYCNNRLIIIGTKTNIEKFLKDFCKDRDEFSMKGMIQKDDFQENNNIWKLRNWGVANDISFCDSCEYIFNNIEQIEDNLYQVKIQYSTEDNSNILFIKNMSKKYRDLKFNLYYFNNNLFFCGQSIYEDNNKIKEEFYNLNSFEDSSDSIIHILDFAFNNLFLYIEDVDLKEYPFKVFEYFKSKTFDLNFDKLYEEYKSKNYLKDFKVEERE